MSIRILLVLPAFAVLTAGPAEALRCDRTDNDRREASRAIHAINTRIDAMEESIVEALRLQTGQIAGYQAQAAKTVTQALDGQTRLQAQTAREVEETRALRSRRPTAAACRTATGMAAADSARRTTETAHQQAARVETGRLTGDRAIVRTPGTAADSAARYAAIAGQWCNAERSGETACRGPANQHEADIRPGTLLDRRTLVGDAERHAAIELSRNLTAPVIPDPQPIASVQTEAERNRVLRARAADARTALAADWFAMLRSLRAPADGLEAWANAAGAGGRDPARPVSRYELLQILAQERMADPTWSAELQEMGTDNLLREIARLLSVSLMLDWERFRLAERNGAMSAAGLAIAVEESRLLTGLSRPVSGVN